MHFRRWTLIRPHRSGSQCPDCESEERNQANVVEREAGSVRGRYGLTLLAMSSDDDDDFAYSAAAMPTPDAEPATVDAIVEEARRYSHFALRELIKVAQGKGGRGSQARAGAARAILELARIVGSEAQELKVKKTTTLPSSVTAVPSTPEQEKLRADMRAELIRRRQQASQQ